jgi:HTH-type transcriptional regulator/antitoxin HigA
MKYRRIHNIDQYNEYCNTYEQLLIKNSKKFSDEIDLLELLIEDYDNRTIETIGQSEDMNPVEILHYLIAENKLTAAELARQLNVSRQLITEILNYKRNISKRMITKLSDRFKMQPIAFSREYDLKGNTKGKNIAA